MLEDKDCIICATKEVYESLVKLGIEDKEAFHMAIGTLLEKEIGEAIDQGFEIGYEAGEGDAQSESYDEGYKDGYYNACEDLAEITISYARNASEE